MQGVRVMGLTRQVPLWRAGVDIVGVADRVIQNVEEHRRPHGYQRREDERQDEGATMQGIGNALYEEMIFEDGFLMNDTMLDYRVPTFEDMPGKMTSIVVENGDGPGPFGAKGCGEGALAAVPAAIVNALADAGVPMTTLPLTPERVWRRIQELRQEGTWQT
jgi:xanthine dehydrogenase molybdopterin-binding subunit B